MTKTNASAIVIIRDEKRELFLIPFVVIASACAKTLQYGPIDFVEVDDRKVQVHDGSRINNGNKRRKYFHGHPNKSSIRSSRVPE
jgi:hypothetical protein